jgi:hypothetical protein
MALALQPEPDDRGGRGVPLGVTWKERAGYTVPVGVRRGSGRDLHHRAVLFQARGIRFCGWN